MKHGDSSLNIQARVEKIFDRIDHYIEART